jgi:hypothetical protein
MPLCRLGVTALAALLAAVPSLARAEGELTLPEPSMPAPVVIEEQGQSPVYYRNPDDRWGGSGRLDLGTATRLPVGGATSQTAFLEPSDGEYQGAAPVAFKLHKAMPGARCQPLDMGGRGQSCEAFFVVDPRVDVPVTLAVTTTYEADRTDGGENDACAVEGQSSVPLGAPRDLAKRTDALFGTRARRVDTLAE